MGKGTTSFSSTGEASLCHMHSLVLVEEASDIAENERESWGYEAINKVLYATVTDLLLLGNGGGALIVPAIVPVFAWPLPLLPK